MTYTIYRVQRTDQRHSHLGFYVDIANSFHLPVGPFPGADAAQQFIKDNAGRLEELYG
jgi:hypothetical protein